MHLKKLKTTLLIITFVLSPILTIPALSYTPASEMRDLNSDHWAYRAIQILVEKYHIMEGFPDKTFKGSKPMSRYELAATLFRIMTRIEELIAESKATISGTEPRIEKTDLETIMALQKEFKEELTQFQGKLNYLEDKIKDMGKIKITGSIEGKYRDRLYVSDDTNEGSPLYNGNPDKDQLNSPSRNYISKKDRFPFRVRTQINIDTNIEKNLSFSTTIIGDDIGFTGGPTQVRSYLAGGHFGEEGLLGSSVFLGKAQLNFEHEWGNKNDFPIKLSLKGGLITFKDPLNTGTILMNHFSDESWIGHGYGLVGWGGDEIQTTNRGISPYINTVSRFWVGDINISRVDPDSKRYNNVVSPGIIMSLDFGVMKFLVGGNFGSVYTNRLIATSSNLSGIGGISYGSDFPIKSGGTLINSNAVVGNLDRLKRLRSNVLDLPSEYGDGYGVIGFEFDLGKPIGNETFPVRLGIHGMDYWNDALFALSGTRKEISGVLDMGTNSTGVTLQVNSSFIGYDMLGFGFFWNNIFGSGLDFGFGSKLALRSLSEFNLNNFASSNLGIYFSLPDFNGLAPKVLLALRQSLGDTWGAETINNKNTGRQLWKDAGITVSVPFNKIMETDLNLTLEYSSLIEGIFWSGKFMAHDFSLVSKYTF